MNPENNNYPNEFEKQVVSLLKKCQSSLNVIEWILGISFLLFLLGLAFTFLTM